MYIRFLKNGVEIFGSPTLGASLFKVQVTLVYVPSFAHFAKIIGKVIL